MINAKDEAVFWEIIDIIPDKVKKIQGILDVNPFKLSDKYFDIPVVADSSIDPNANVMGKSPNNFHTEIFKPQMKLRGYFELWKRLVDKYGYDEAKESLIFMLDGSLYFHDITKIDIPYCFAFDTSFVATQGRPYGWLPGAPPKRSSSFIGQVVETTMDFSQQLAGAVGIPNILINLAYYTRKERSSLHKFLEKISGFNNQILAICMFVSGLGYSGSQFKVEIDTEDLEEKLLSYYNSRGDITIDTLADMAYNKYIEDLMQQFVHVMHNTFRVGGDSPFTNISVFDSVFLKSFFADASYPDFSCPVDNIPEIMGIQKVFIEFFSKGSPLTSKRYKFPVATVNIKKWSLIDFEKGLCSREQIDKIADWEFYVYVLSYSLEKGVFNFHVGEKVATCCRLTSDLWALKESIKQDTFGNGGISIGSGRVSANNLHRAALVFKSKNLDNQRDWNEFKSEFFEVLRKYLEASKKVLIVHKELLKDRINSKFLKFFEIDWCNLNQFFSTIGYTGLWDAYSVLFPDSPPQSNKDLYVEVSGDILDYMDEFCKIAGKENPGYAFNVEEIPGENACPKLAELDNYYFSNQDWYSPVFILANQMVPLYVHMDLFDRLDISGKLMNRVSGGAMLHLNISDEMTLGASVELNRIIIEDYNIPHYAICVGSSTCVNGHVSRGIHWVCPVCDGEIFTHTIRIIGYDSDTKLSWNEARRKEFKQRQFYSSEDLLSLLK